MEIKQNKYSQNFKGKVYFTNKTAREYAKEYRNIIHTLKHHTANNTIDHFISLNFYNNKRNVLFLVNTQYKHPYKIGGVNMHEHQITYVGRNFQNGIKYIAQNLETIGEWKRNIDLTMQHEQNLKHHAGDIFTHRKSKKNNILDRIKAYFAKLFSTNSYFADS